VAAILPPLPTGLHNAPIEISKHGEIIDKVTSQSKDHPQGIERF
jgi:hypothetical protein